MGRGATISGCRRYRYRLWREWNHRKPYLAWILLNPSTADGNFDDPTIRRLIGFTAAFGYGGLHVVNLFALRATNPKRLLEAEDPIGPENDRVLQSYAHWPIVAAWGALGGLRERNTKVLELLVGADIKCLGYTKEGHPKHPLYLPKAAKLIPFAEGVANDL